MSTSNSSKNARCGICAATDHLLTYRITAEGTDALNSNDYRMLCQVGADTSEKLQSAGAIPFKGVSHHSKFASIKNAVKKDRGLGNRNLFSS